MRNGISEDELLVGIGLSLFALQYHPILQEAAKLLRNLVYRSGYLKATIKEGVAALKPYAREMEVVHIKIDYPDPSTWRKKKYWHISKEEVCSRLKYKRFLLEIRKNAQANTSYYPHHWPSRRWEDNSRAKIEQGIKNSNTTYRLS